MGLWVSGFRVGVRFRIWSSCFDLEFRVHFGFGMSDLGFWAWFPGSGDDPRVSGVVPGR